MARYDTGVRYNSGARYASGPLPPAPARKARKISAINPYPELKLNPMALPYIIIPNPTGNKPFRARIKLGAQVEQSELLAATAADAAVDVATVEKVIRSLFKIIVGHARTGRAIGLVLGLFRAQPSIRGAFSTNTPSAEELKAGIDLNLTAGPDAEAALLDALSVEKVGEEGTVAPEVETVTLSPGGQPDKYSSTAALKVSGTNLRASGSGSTWPGVALVNADGSSPVALTVYACSQSEMLVSPAPGATTGTKYLRITAGWDPSLIVQYQNPLEKQP